MKLHEKPPLCGFSFIFQLNLINDEKNTFKYIATRDGVFAFFCTRTQRVYRLPKTD